MNFDRRALLLYAVTDRTWLKGKSLAWQVEESLKGGVTMLQLREKTLDAEQFRAEALEMKALCQKYHVPFLINDNVELALAVDADGVHVGQDDMKAGQVRALLGTGKIVGVSVHTVDEALEAQAAGADYLGLGSVFPTGTKAGVDIMPRETIQDICAAVDIPCVAIGGISPDNLWKLSGCGLAGVSVVSAIYAQPDIQAAARTLRERSEEMIQT